MREIAQKLSRCSSFGALMDDAFARCPEREAIVYEDWRLTYGDLERYIHQTAHYLRHLGVRTRQPYLRRGATCMTLLQSRLRYCRRE